MDETSYDAAFGGHENLRVPPHRRRISVRQGHESLITYCSGRTGHQPAAARGEVNDLHALVELGVLDAKALSAVGDTAKANVAAYKAAIVLREISGT